MDKLKFLQLIQNPNMLSPALRADLIDIAENYPYFQGVYALLSKLTKNDEAISQAAIRTTNRDVLKDFLSVEAKKKDKREVIENLDLHTEQINAFEKFENLEEEEAEQIEAAEGKALEEEQEGILSENDDFEQKILLEEEFKEEVEEISDETFEEQVEDTAQASEVNPKETVFESEKSDFPVFEEPDYLKAEEELSNTEIEQKDTSKELPEYKQSSGGSFFDDIAEEEFAEVTFEEKKEVKSTNFFEQVEDESYKEKNVEDKENSTKIADQYGEEAQILSTTIFASESEEVKGKDIQKKTTSIDKKELSYADYHLKEGEILPPNTKNPVKKSGKSKEDIQYEDYHLTPSSKEVKIIPPDVKKSEKAPKEEKKDKPSDNFFDSF